jgi:hypothetical protein
MVAMEDDPVPAVDHPHGRRVRLVAVPAAAAATETAPREQRREDITTYSAVQRIPFDDDFVEGDRQGPDDEVITEPPPVVHSSLIEIRQHFVPEMVKSLEDF